jgi:hypothetical protein
LKRSRKNRRIAVSDKPIHAIAAGKWSVGFSKSTGQTLLMFEFSDREAINLALPQQHAVALANTILAQAKIA